MPLSRLSNFLHYPWEHFALFFFILTLPFSLRNVLWSFSPTGAFNEYTDISLYFSDITLLLFVTLVILKHVLLRKSIQCQMFHVEHIYYATPFFLWALATTFWSENKILALYANMKLLEGYILFLSLIWLKRRENLGKMLHVEQMEGNVPRGTSKKWLKMFHVEHLHLKFLALNFIRKCSTWNIWYVINLSFIISGLFQAIIAIFQFFFQKSIGLQILGESFLSRSMPGIAKIILGSETYIRSYGLFPHPNVLGGFLAFTLFISLLYPLFTTKKLFHVEHRWIRLFLKISIVIQFLALLSTFSKSAVVGFAIGAIFFIYKVWQMFHVEHFEALAPRGTSKKWLKMFHVEHSLIVAAVILLIIAIFQWINPHIWLIQSLHERLFFYYSFLRFSLGEIIFGLGTGQYVFLLQNFYPQSLELWQYQPVHNVFFLILGETGLIGLGLFLIFITFLIFPGKVPMFHVEQVPQNVPRGTFVNKMFSFSMIILLFFPAITDHYWWDIQQGQLLFWSILGLTYILNIDKK